MSGINPLAHLKLIAHRMGLGKVDNTNVQQAQQYLSRLRLSIESRDGAFSICATKAATEKLTSSNLNVKQMDVITGSFALFIQQYHKGEVGNVTQSYKQSLAHISQREGLSLREEMLLHSKADVLSGICKQYLVKRHQDKKINGCTVGEVLTRYPA